MLCFSGDFICICRCLQDNVTAEEAFDEMMRSEAGHDAVPESRSPEALPETANRHDTLSPSTNNAQVCTSVTHLLIKESYIM